jgi:hypothetical protein
MAFFLALILAAPQATASTNDSPAVAASDDDFLAVWSNRSAVSDPALILAAPFDRGGAPQGGIVIIGSSLDAPSLAWTGQDYLVALRAAESVQVRRLGKNGMPLAAATTAIASLPLINADSQRQTRIVWNGVHAIVMSSEAGSVIGALLSHDGSVIQSLTLAQDASLADATTTLTETLAVVIGRNRALSARLIDDSGNVSPPLAIASEPVIGAAAASDGGRFLIVWVNDARQLRASSVDAGGNVSEPVTLFTIGEFAALVPPALTWDGHRFIVAWGGPIPGTFGSKPTAFFLAEVTATGVGEIDIPHGGLGATALAGADDAVAVVFIDADGLVRERIHRGRLDNASAILSVPALPRRRPVHP